MSPQPEDKRRFRNRRLTQIQDLIRRFESQPSSHHIHDVIGAIQRLRDDGCQFWEADSDQLARWRKACNVLLDFLNTLGKRRYSEQQSLETALREFVEAFEHSTLRMRQMLHGHGEDPERPPPEVDAVFRWIDLVYRLSTYALLSYWIDDKTEERATRISVNMTTGERSEETEVVREMQVPKRYQRGARLGR